MLITSVVPFPVPREVAFDYLVEPRNRVQWQSSLARVEDVDGAPRVGQTWVDVTRPGLRPRLETDWEAVIDRTARAMIGYLGADWDGAEA